MVAKNSIAQIWWRDDDASRPTSNLDWMLKTIDSLEFKPLLAAIPNLSSRKLAKALEINGLPIAVHGLSHSNYEPADSRKSEFGPSRDLHDIKKISSKQKNSFPILLVIQLLTVLFPHGTGLEKTLFLTSQN